MSLRILHFRTKAATATTVVLCVLLQSAWGLKNAKTDFWETKESLMLRLSAEWSKIEVLQRESASIADVLSTIRNIELYPQTLTGYDDEKLVKFDKAIETLEKKNRQIDERIAAFKPPLGDAIAIFRELVVGDPVESMFATLENANLVRITEMLQVKHQLDTLWVQTDTLLTITLKSMSITKEIKPSGPMEDDFFQILKANLGLQADDYYIRLNGLKDHLISKATAEQVAEMAQIERHHITRYITEGNFALAGRKTADAIDRFSKVMNVTEFTLLMARIRFQEGAYGEVLTILEKATGPNAAKTRILYRMQSLYALHEYDSILADTLRNDVLSLDGADLNLALWITMESALALGKTELPGRLAGYLEKGKPYSLHVLHAFARSYLSRGDDSTALSILEKARTYKVVSGDDRIALQEISISIAQLYYERHQFDKALELFYGLINNEQLFERALSGIAWCYLQSGRFDKAETALRKLINQSPEKSWGAEGLLVLSRRYLQIASFAWKKQGYVTKEKNRLTRLIGRLDTLSKSGSAKQSAGELAYARAEVTRLLDRINNEKLPDYAALSSYYDKIDRLCSFITSHYNTGTYQETTFSKNRERMLTAIDSVAMDIEASKKTATAEGMLSHARQERIKIRQIVDKTLVFSSISLIDRYRWEREYIDWRKAELKRGKSVTGDAGSGEKKNPGEKIDLLKSPEMDSLLAREDALQQDYSKRMSERIGNLLKMNIDHTDKCYLKYQLAELAYRAENNAYAIDYENYDHLESDYRKALERFRSGSQVELPREPAVPVLRHDGSMRLYREAVAADFASKFGGASIYGLAWCFNDIGKLDSAFTYMNIIATEFRDHPYAAQAWMFCGEYLFDKGDLKGALAAFYTVMKYPESEWFDEALYKVAWTQYRLSNPEKAISSFLALVDLGGERFGHSLLEKESMDYIAISFSETDVSGEKGLERAAAFARKLGDTERGCQILHRLGQVYRDQGRHDMAKKTFNLILSVYPNFSRNPTVEAELLAVLDRDATSETAIDQKYAYFKKYSRESSWAQRQSDSIRIKADTTSRNMLFSAAMSYHQLALQKNNDSLYRKAITAYTDFIGFYPLAAQANECHYNLAEIQFSRGDYRSAAEEYIAVSRRYPDSNYKETAAWNAIVASQNLLKLEKPPQR